MTVGVTPQRAWEVEPVFLAAMEPDAKEHVLSLLKDAINHYGLGRIETAKLDVQEKFQLSGQQVEQLVTHLNGMFRGQ